MASAPAKYDMSVYPMTMAVRSASDGAAVHTVHLPWCDCADFTNRKGRQTETSDGAPAVTICKHIAAALERVGGWHAAPEPAKPAHNVYEGCSFDRAFILLTDTEEGNMTSAEAAALIRRTDRDSVGVEPHAHGEILVKLTAARPKVYTVKIPLPA